MISNCALYSETPLSIDRNVSAKKTIIFNLHLIKMETGHLIRNVDQNIFSLDRVQGHEVFRRFHSI